MTILHQLARRQRQKIVYWAPLGADAYGRPTHASPVEVKGRWEDGTDEVITADGTNTYSSAKVYSATPMLPGGWCMLGTLDEVEDSTFPDNAKESRRVFEIVVVSISPNAKNKESLVTAFLK
jgi:hypothetical protein